MIGPDYCRAMARYNGWQNAGLARAFEGLSHEALVAGRGAFFGSILATASHLLWGDRIWLSRFGACTAPPGGIAGSTDLFATRMAWAEGRAETDAALVAWAAALAPGDLDGDLTWFSGAVGAEVTKPRALCAMHMFNHQTHHRGQIHAMLTAAGAEPTDSDLFIMPDAATTGA
ncbi:MAG: DinB family protein [Shimia sp.]